MKNYNEMTKREKFQTRDLITKILEGESAYGGACNLRDEEIFIQADECGERFEIYRETINEDGDGVRETLKEFELSEEALAQSKPLYAWNAVNRAELWQNAGALMDEIFENVKEYID